jgi:hypothetical protein
VSNHAYKLCGALNHGWLVFQYVESLAKDGDFGGVFEAHRGRRAFEFLRQVDGHVANGTQNKGSVAGAGSAVVFAEMCVQNVKATFDKPAASQMLQQECRIGLFSR